MKPAIWIEGINDTEYDNIEALRCTAFKCFCRSAAHYKAYLTAPKSRSEAFRFGSIVHLALLQPDQFDKRMVIAPECDKRTTVGKAAYAAFQANLSSDSMIVTHDEAVKIVDMRQSFLNFAGNKISNAVFERPGVATLFGVDCKIKPDIFCFDTVHNVYTLADLKTTEDASESAFTRAIYTYNYHLQAAFYALVTEEIIGFPVDTFTFYAIEKEAPYAIREYILSKSAMDYAKQIVCRKLALFQSCQAMDLWEGYSRTAVNVELPRWLVDYDL